jgi:sorting nexin-4
MNTALRPNLCRSVDDFATMYERVRIVQAHTSAERPSTSESSDTSDVTPAPSPASTPPSTAIDDPRHDCDRNCNPNPNRLDDSHDWEDLGELKPSDNPKRMADDFREGRLETIVGTPQKELPGTKDAYVSYQITTKVGFPPQSVQRSEANL